MKRNARLTLTALLLAPLAALAADQKSTAELRVLQFNVWQEGTSVPGGLEKIAEAIVQSRADVVAFSEVRNYRGEDWHEKILAALKAKAPELNFRGQFVGGDVGLISRFPIASTATAFGKKTTSWAPKSDERDWIDFIYYSADAGLRPVRAWVVGPRTCFAGERKVDDPGEDPFLCADLPWPSDHKGVLVEFAY